jgi:hypothetical protein
MSLEQLIDPLIQPINGQRPRPWFTDYADPENARVFVVGANPASSYLEENLSHERHVNALFNRNGESCRVLYAELDGSNKSRPIIDRFCQRLASRGIHDVLQTNVVCYSTEMAAELSQAQHRPGTIRGTDVFRTLVRCVAPRIIIVHGVGAAERLGKLYRIEIPRPQPSKVPTTQVIAAKALIEGHSIEFISIPTLALPGANAWKFWREAYSEVVADHIVEALPCDHGLPRFGDQPDEPAGPGDRDT